MKLKRCYSFSIKKLKNIIIYGFFLFAFLKPDSLEYIGLQWLDKLLVITDGLVMTGLIVLLVLRKYKMSIFSALIFSIYFFIGVYTFLGTKDYFSLIKVAGTTVGFSLFTDFMIQRKPDIYFKGSIIVLTALFLINLVTIIQFYPEGMYKTDKVNGDLYFMGHDNGMIYNLIPLCALSLLYSYLKLKKIWTWYTLTSFSLAFFSEIYVRSATGIIEVLLLLLLVVMYDNRYFRKIIRPEILFGFYFIVNILLVYFRIQKFFSGLIVGVFGKDVTLTGRTYLWDYAIQRIVENNFQGYGMGTLIYGVNGHTYPHCHNLLLDFLYTGGFFSLILFTILLFVFSKKYHDLPDKKIGKLILIPLFILLFGETTAAIPYKVFFWSFFVLIQYVDQIQNSLK